MRRGKVWPRLRAVFVLVRDSLDRSAVGYEVLPGGKERTFRRFADFCRLSKSYKLREHQ